MSLPSFTQKKGTNAEDEPILTWTDRYQNSVYLGRINSETRLKQIHLSIKDGGNNRRKLLGDTSTWWIPPSDYHRTVINQKWGNEFQVKTTGTGPMAIVDNINANDVWSDARDAQVPYGAFNWNYGGKWHEELASESLTKAITRFKDKKMDLGENLATAAQTYSMVADLAANLCKAVVYTKNGQIGKAVALLRDHRSIVRQGADILLQFKYGWKPLMSDIAGGIELLQEQVKPALLMSASAKSAREHIRVFGSNDRIVGGKGYRQCYTKLYGRVQSKYARLIDRVGLANPATLAWELVPFSFVTDWFLPIGPVLDAMASPAGVDFVGGFTTLRSALVVESETILPANVRGNGVKNSHEGFSIERRPYSGPNWPRPGLYSVNPFSHSHGESAFALWLQKMFSKRGDLK